MFIVQPLFPGTLLTNAAAIYYTAPKATGSSNGVNTRISNATVTNLDSAPRTVTIYITPASAAPNPQDTVILNKTLAINETFVLYQMIGNVLAPGNSIQALADVGAKVAFNASGIEFS